jgi:hypothetical protein
MHDARGEYLESFSEGRFEVFVEKAKEKGMCDDTKIFDTVNSRKVATIQLCEDTIKSIEQVGNSVEVVTDRGKKYVY